MRPLLAVAAVLTVAACAPAQQPSQSAATTVFKSLESPAASESAEPSKPSRTSAERAYLDQLDATLGKYLEKGESLNAASYIRQGREICDQAADDRVEAVSAAIDGMDSEGDVYRAALTKLCPKQRKVWVWASAGIADGEHTVGKGIKPGTYRTLRRPVAGCYWERSTGNGQIIANQRVTNAPAGVTVTVRSGEGFTSRRCGPWVRA